MSVPHDKEINQLEQELRQPLSQIMTHPITSHGTAMLIKALQPAFDGLKEASDEERFSLRQTLPSKRPSLFRLMHSQLSSYSRVYWVASLMVFGMLMLMLPTNEYVSYISVAQTFTFVLPALLLASLAYSFRSWNKEMRMIESITPYPPALLLIVRTMIVIGLNLVFGLLGSIYMNIEVRSFPLLPFVLQWLSLMLLVSGVTAYILMWKGFKAAFACSALLWLFWNGVEQRVLPTNELSNTGNATAMYLSALIAGILLLSLAYKKSFGRRLLP
ncbi:hypothetical protein Back11_62470 [Paenibacillus baekrokdamisoli]|uniref:Uncharacterized protein n=1 Tax=Paenibacillus baekrokdamisoli TaxID=1712516 RepID=A0A3G9J2W2_9BACL|nr:hypothetical protein [Paenibacillus baekrokdamisoli]MBB3069524.1 hypothetical protein [Paenibacillus baekrokdamisoli]BBH24902.1 hypothetical protein Back11_62470 [Paenibacillus baekrokdamisoli]